MSVDFRGLQTGPHPPHHSRSFLSIERESPGLTVGFVPNVATTTLHAGAGHSFDVCLKLCIRGPDSASSVGVPRCFVRSGDGVVVGDRESSKVGVAWVGVVGELKAVKASVVCVHEGGGGDILSCTDGQSPTCSVGVARHAWDCWPCVRVGCPCT